MKCEFNKFSRLFPWFRHSFYLWHKLCHSLLKLTSRKQIKNKMRRILVLNLLLSFSLVSHTQTDDPWWKKLFRSETVETQDEKKQDTLIVIDTLQTVPTPTPIIKDSLVQTSIGAPIKGPGNITYKFDPALASMDSLYKAEPPVLNGYRIKIYFGNLEQARGTRVNYISAGYKDGCYLKQYPPNFAVLVGNFRSQTEAYKRLNELKALYPGASIVRSEIEISRLD